MKKYLLVLLVAVAALFSAKVQAQELMSFKIGMGASITTLDVLDANPAGVIFEFDISRFYIGVGSNFAHGKGEYLEFSSSETRSADKKSWISLNVGYSFPFRNGWSVLGKCGFVMIDKIWNDPVGWDTYYRETEKTIPQIGVGITKEFKSMYVRASTSTTELAAFTIGFGF